MFSISLPFARIDFDIPNQRIPFHETYFNEVPFVYVYVSVNDDPQTSLFGNGIEYSYRLLLIIVSISIIEKLLDIFMKYIEPRLVDLPFIFQ